MLGRNSSRNRISPARRGHRGEHEAGGTSVMYLSAVPFKKLVTGGNRLGFRDDHHVVYPRLTQKRRCSRR
jgi:hypothetical protein